MRWNVILAKVFVLRSMGNELIPSTLQIVSSIIVEVLWYCHEVFGIDIKQHAD